MAEGDSQNPGGPQGTRSSTKTRIVRYPRPPTVKQAVEELQVAERVLIKAMRKLTARLHPFTPLTRIWAQILFQSTPQNIRECGRCKSCQIQPCRKARRETWCEPCENKLQDPCTHLAQKTGCTGTPGVMAATPSGISNLSGTNLAKVVSDKAIMIAAEKTFEAAIQKVLRTVADCDPGWAKSWADLDPAVLQKRYEDCATQLADLDLAFDNAEDQVRRLEEFQDASQRNSPLLPPEDPRSPTLGLNRSLLDNLPAATIPGLALPLIPPITTTAGLPSALQLPSTAAPSIPVTLVAPALTSAAATSTSAVPTLTSAAITTTTATQAAGGASSRLVRGITPVLETSVRDANRRNTFMTNSPLPHNYGGVQTRTYRAPTNFGPANSIGAFVFPPATAQADSMAACSTSQGTSLSSSRIELKQARLWTRFTGKLASIGKALDDWNARPPLEAQLRSIVNELPALGRMLEEYQEVTDDFNDTLLEPRRAQEVRVSTDRYNKAVTDIREMSDKVRKIKLSDSMSVHSGPIRSTGASFMPQRKSQLARLFGEFRRVFMELAEPEGFGDASFLAHLRSKLPQEAKDLIVGLQTKEQVLDRLDKRYGDRETTIYLVKEQLRGLKLKKKTDHERVEELGQAMEKAMSQLRAVDASNSCDDDYLLMTKLVRKLPPSHQIMWDVCNLRAGVGTRARPKWTIFSEWMKEMADAAPAARLRDVAEEFDRNQERPGRRDPGPRGNQMSGPGRSYTGESKCYKCDQAGHQPFECPNALGTSLATWGEPLTKENVQVMAEKDSARVGQCPSCNSHNFFAKKMPWGAVTSGPPTCSHHAQSWRTQHPKREQRRLHFMRPVIFAHHGNIVTKTVIRCGWIMALVCVGGETREELSVAATTTTSCMEVH